MSDQSRNDKRVANDVADRAGQHGLRTAIIIVVIVFIAGVLIWQIPSDGADVSDHASRIVSR